MRSGRTPEEITSTLAAGPHAGECETCHTQHAGRQGIAYEHALIGPDDNSLCDRCHAEPWAGGSYPGTWIYNGSAHGTRGDAVWPGPDPPARDEADARGKCLNCHDPHGWQDGSGTIPQLALAREEALCLACHDGLPAASNIRSDLQKPYRHPTADYDGRHRTDESSPADFAAAPLPRRHAECTDCHNPHVARGDFRRRRGGGGEPRVLPESAVLGLSKRLLGVSRVAVLNGPAGTRPAYTFIPASDTLSGTPAEYQVCFKCHSSWTVQPSGQSDLGLLLNPNNPSYHPVQASGKNVNIHPLAFTSGWHAGSRTTCGDCHGSDLGERGPHGSVYRFILSRPYTASSLRRTMTPDENCFTCHKYDVYANPSAPASLHSTSRFNPPGSEKGHAEHVGDKGVPCFACHATHGSTTLAHLLETGRNPGLSSYQRTPTGGSCSSTCHEPKTYDANYPR